MVVNPDHSPIADPPVACLKTTIQSSPDCQESAVFHRSLSREAIEKMLGLNELGQTKVYQEALCVNRKHVGNSGTLPRYKPLLRAIIWTT
jgi:hypothetical protein